MVGIAFVIVAYAMHAAIVFAVAGLICRRRYASSLLLGVFLVGTLIADQLMLQWPERFYNRSFWFGKELLLHGLTLGIAFEMGLRIFRAFPSAKSTARFVVGLVLIATAISVLPVWSSDWSLGAAALPVQTRLLNGAVWLFTALAAVVLWYRLPISALQKALLVGFVPYLLASTAGLSYLESATTPQTWQSNRPLINLGMGIAFLVVVSYWNYVIWRPATETVQAAEPEEARSKATLLL